MKQTKKKKTIKVRTKLTAKPTVLKHQDFNGVGSLIRILTRQDKSRYAEFAIYMTRHPHSDILRALRFAGFKNEEKGKWVLRTDKFNIFVYF